MTADNNPQMMLDIRWADGLEDSYPYFQLVGMRLDGAFLRLFFQHNTVLVKGRHVRELRNKLRKNCVEYMQERHHQAHLVPESEPYIEEITIAPPDLEALGRRPL